MHECSLSVERLTPSFQEALKDMLRRSNALPASHLRAQLIMRPQVLPAPTNNASREERSGAATTAAEQQASEAQQHKRHASGLRHHDDDPVVPEETHVIEEP